MGWARTAAAPGAPAVEAIPTIGVLSTKPQRIAAMLRSLFGARERTEVGYAIEAVEAFSLLAKHAPEAEKWWRFNATHLYRKGSRLVFAEEACELVDFRTR